MRLFGRPLLHLGEALIPLGRRLLNAEAPLNLVVGFIFLVYKVAHVTNDLSHVLDNPEAGLRYRVFLLPNLGCVDELPHHHPGCHEVNEGQKRPTELVISRSNTPAVFECVEQPFPFLAAFVLCSIRGDRFETIRLAGDHGCHALLRKHLPNRLAVLGLGHDGGVQLGESREVVPHQLEARGIMPRPTGQH